MYILCIVIVISGVGLALFLNRPEFGHLPQGVRKTKIENSPHYWNGKFQNELPTRQITSDGGMLGVMSKFFFGKDKRVKPDKEIPSVKTDLHTLNRREDVAIWFGHSSLFIQLDGIRFLIDPVLSKSASPVKAFNKAFPGSYSYTPEDIPEIDYLIITHDHWDHLDYPTVMKLKPRVGKVICPLGVGAHFEYWKFNPHQIIEMDWYEEEDLEDGFHIYALPARHFAGRGLKSNQSLWASFLLKTPSMNIYIGGDGGYDHRFEKIGKKFENIDLAILETGQYNKDWRYIHMLPDEWAIATKDLKAKTLLPVHHSKFALANHAWDEPLEVLYGQKNSLGSRLLHPMIGEKIFLKDETQEFKKWW